MQKQASEGKAPSEARLFPVCGLFCGQKQKPKLKPAKIVIKSKENTHFLCKSGCFVELLGGFEPPTSSLPILFYLFLFIVHWFHLSSIIIVALGVLDFSCCVLL